MTIKEADATVALFFDPDAAWTGEAPLLEIRLTPAEAGTFEPWLLARDLSLYVQYARASLARKYPSVDATLRALRQANAPRRGLDDDFLKLVAERYHSLVAEGDRHPVTTLAKLQHVDTSNASRWISAARARGLLHEEGKES